MRFSFIKKNEAFQKSYMKGAHALEMALTERPKLAGRWQLQRARRGRLRTPLFHGSVWLWRVEEELSSRLYKATQI